MPIRRDKCLMKDSIRIAKIAKMNNQIIFVCFVEVQHVKIAERSIQRNHTMGQQSIYGRIISP